MNYKKIAFVFAAAMTISAAAAGCSFGGEEPIQEVVETPTPEPTQEPTPEPTIAPDVQDTTYTSSNKTLSIKLPDATWGNKTDEEDTVSFESPQQGKILILHGKGEEDMSSAVIPNTQDLAVSLEQASDLEQGTDFELQNYTAEDVSGVGVYSYLVKYLDTEKSGGYAYSVNKVFANDQEFYNICGSVKDEASLASIQEAVASIQILGDSTLKAAAPGTKDEAGEGEDVSPQTEPQETPAPEDAGDDGNAQESVPAEGGDAAPVDDGTYGNSAGFTAEQLRDTNQTRTIYRNSDGHPLVITPDGSGNWKDFDGNTYRFVNNEDVYDQNDVDYYWHGEGADVYYMPVE